MASGSSSLSASAAHQLRTLADDSHRYMAEMSKHHHLSHNTQLKTLLRAISGRLHVLSLLVVDLCEGNDVNLNNPSYGDLAVLSHCDSSLRRLRAIVEMPESEPMARVGQDETDDFQSILTSLTVAINTNTLSKLVACLSTPGSQMQAVPPAGSPADPKPYGPMTLEDGLAAASRTVELIMNPRFDTPITGYHQYCTFATETDALFPEYAQAVLALPAFAETYWGDLVDPLEQLFTSSPTSNKFLHWILEYCRQLWPRVYGPDAMSTTPTLRLLANLGGDLHVIHIAAALGLPHVCRAVRRISRPRPTNRHGPLGTTLYCALVGPLALQGREDTHDRLAQLGPPSIAQEDTLRWLFRSLRASVSDDKAAPRKYEGFSTQAMTFVVMLRLRKYDLFAMAFNISLEIDGALKRMVKMMSFTDFPWARSTSSTQGAAFLAFALTRLFDICIRDNDGDFRDDSVCAEIDVAMRTLKLGIWDPEDTVQSTANSISDDDFESVVILAMEENAPSVLFRLTKDRRWNPDMPTQLGESTILHKAVSEDLHEIIRHILNSGANVLALDNEGKTPILLAETPTSLSILIEAGANTTDTDKDGRNLWHMAAANNDCEVISWLQEHDPHKAANSTAITNDGFLPITEALIYPLIAMRNLYWLPGITQKRLPYQAAKLLLRPYLEESGSLGDRGPICLAFPAAEWGDLNLLRDLETAGVSMDRVDSNGNSALHFLNFSADDQFVAALQARGAREINSSGQTAAEAIFLTRARGFPDILPPDTMPDSGKLLSHYPGCTDTLNGKAFRLLLTPAVINSVDAQGQHFFHRFLVDILFRWAFRVPCGTGSKVATSLQVAVEALAKQGVLKAFEEATGKSAVGHFLEVVVAEAPVRGGYFENWEECLHQCGLIILDADGVRHWPLDKTQQQKCLRLALATGREWIVTILERLNPTLPCFVEGRHTIEFLCKKQCITIGTFRKVVKLVEPDPHFSTPPRTLVPGNAPDDQLRLEILESFGWIPAGTHLWASANFPSLLPPEMEE